MSQNAKALLGILLMIVLITLIAKGFNGEGRKCVADGGTWVKNPGSVKTGWHCEMPK